MILCCGEALVDMIPVQTADGRPAFAPVNGGAVFNTAIALGRLGAQTGLFTGLSRDAFGQQLEQGLIAAGVDASLAARSDRLTTLAVVHLSKGQATYSFYDENSAGRMLAPDDLPQVPDTVDALFFGGISLVSEPAADTYATMLDRNHTGRVVMIDPNIRPDFITDEPRYRARIDRMLAQADIVKLSDEDLAWLVPDGGLSDRAARIASGGPRVVIVTLGTDGAVAWLDGAEVRIPAVAANVADTVGAGDTFNAGVMAHLCAIGALTPDGFAGLSPETLTDALTLGARAAAVTVSRAGANPPFRHELPDPA